MHPVRALTGASRAIAFGRHLPVTKVLRRVELDLRRRVRDRLPIAAARPAKPAPAIRQSAPQPVFPSRGGMTAAPDGSLVFSALGRELIMSEGRIDWNAPGRGGAHQLMRMNLHYMEYLESVDNALFADLIAQWIDANPANGRGAWRDGWNSYALSLRVVVWMQQLGKRAGDLDAEFLERVHGSLAVQLRFLEANLETDLGGNHLIKNIKALLWASAYFEGTEADRWQRLGNTLLAGELGSQILADGIHDERSPSYHCQVFADLIECRFALGLVIAGDANGLPASLDETLQRMAQAVADLSHPDGAVAQFNDAGLTMAYAPSACLDAFAQLAGSKPTAQRVFAYPQAGYFGARSESEYIIADCGRIAPDDLPAHGHGDVLSFEWSVAGRRIIVDQGVFEYIAGDARQRSRSAANHNTLSIEGTDQADFFGAFRCGRRPDVTVHNFAEESAGFTLDGSHNGFEHLSGRPRHRRQFTYSPGQLQIEDKIEGTTERAAHAGFLLHPDVSVEVEGQEARLISGDTCIDLRASVPIACRPAVWWPDMGSELATQRLWLALPAGARQITTTFTVRSHQTAP